MNVLGVIIARAGSAGLRNKHLLPLLGRPVIKYTFAHARQAKLLTRVVVSTDAPQIRRMAEANFFAIIKRPPALATADASVQDVMLHAMDTVEQTSAFRADALVVLYGNVPVRTDGVIDVQVGHEGRNVTAVFVATGKTELQREIAAWKVDVMLGLGIVPATVDREVAGRRGYLQARPAKSMTQAEVQAKGVVFSGRDPPAGLISIFELPTPGKPSKFVAGFTNFEVVTRYNRSTFYASAVLELGEAIRKAHKQVQLASTQGPATRSLK
jgi:GTP:adenosylcobinamide-phosphate guanylyltransferase